MHIAIAGGNGYIGRTLTGLLRSGGHEVVWLSHRPGRPLPNAENGPDLEVGFNPHSSDGGWAEQVASAHAVVNLSGYPIASRWNDSVKRLLRESRVETGRALVRTIAGLDAGNRPAAYVSASGIGYYGDRGDDLLAEDEPAGNDWLSSLAADWEAEALKAREAGIRTVIVRTGLVLGTEGLVPRMALPFRLFAGGPIGTGKQWVSAIHIDDIARVYAQAITNDTLEGPVNGSAEPRTMKDFARAFGSAMHRPSWFPVPRTALRVVLGEVADYTLMSQRADTTKLRESGFTWIHPDPESALGALLR